jgi:Flp pilus assembly protein CpaB
VTTVLRRRSGEPGGQGGGTTNAGTAGRKRPLPNGRAVVGAFLMAAAATIVLTAWLTATGSHGRRWVVANRPLAAGARIEPADLRTEIMTLPADTSATSFASAGTLVGRTLSSPLAAGELVQQSALVPVGQQPALRPVTVPIVPADAADLSAGALVDVLETSGNGPNAQTSVVLRGARVISVANPGSSLIASSSGTEVTLGVGSLRQVEAVIHAEHTATISVVVGEPSDGAGLGSPMSAGQGR